MGEICSRLSTVILSPPFWRVFPAQLTYSQYMYIQRSAPGSGVRLRLENFRYTPEIAAEMSSSCYPVLQRCNKKRSP